MKPILNTRHPILNTFKLAVIVTVLSVVSLLLLAPRTYAEGIGIAPLEYKSNLNGATKKGTVDITNTSGTEQQITIQIQAFRQIDNKGTLQFYSDPLISAGITPDYNQFTLQPGERIHLYFLLNGQKLPKKQIFAALLAQAKPTTSGYNITPVLRVGTLLILKNGNGDPPKQGQINNWRVGLFQFGNNVTGSFDFKNTEKGESASGYFPSFRVSVSGASQSFSGDLVFPGIQRTQSFSLPGSRIGIYNLKLTSNAGAGASQWVVVVTGYWRWLLPLIIILLVVAIVTTVRWRKARSPKPSKRLR